MTTTQEKTVPTLRFPEFIKEWDSFKLGDVAVFSKGKGISKADIEEGGAIECIRYGQLYTDYAETIKDVKSRTNIPLKDLVLSEANDIIIPASGETQLDIATASCVLKSDIALGGDLNIIKTKHDGIFLSYYLNSKRKLDIARLSQGISVVHLYAAQLKLLHLNLPGDTEQQKIVSFLTSVDTKIEQLGKKKTLLEHYKKGMMQKLFSQEFRFKDDQGNDYPDWKMKKLRKVLALNLRERDKPNHNYLAIGVRSHMKGTFQKPNSEPTKIAMEKLFVVKKDDLVVNITFAWEGAIALAKAEDDGGYVSHRFPTYTCISGKLLPEYIKQVILDKRFKYLLDLISPGGAGRNRVLSKKNFLRLEWLFPTVQEQLKIADFLSAIDKKIELIASELKKAQTFKKGLLQQMFV